MIHMIPIIVVGGVTKKFSTAFLGGPNKVKGKGRGKVKTVKANYPSKYKPF